MRMPTPGCRHDNIHSINQSTSCGIGVALVLSPMLPMGRVAGQLPPLSLHRRSPAQELHGEAQQQRHRTQPQQHPHVELRRAVLVDTQGLHAYILGLRHDPVCVGSSLPTCTGRVRDCQSATQAGGIQSFLCGRLRGRGGVRTMNGPRAPHRWVLCNLKDPHT